MRKASVLFLIEVRIGPNLNLWLFVLLLPGQMIFFFETGPLAWNGVLAFYLPFAVFGLWFPIAFWVLRRAVQGVEAEREAKPVEPRAAPVVG